MMCKQEAKRQQEPARSQIGGMPALEARSFSNRLLQSGGSRAGADPLAPGGGEISLGLSLTCGWRMECSHGFYGNFCVR